jgi:hypothetical protein
MPYTPPGELYVGLHDRIFPKIIRVITDQRPSLLNYATPYFASHPDFWCRQIPDPSNGTPRFTQVPAIKYLDDKNVPPVEFVAQLSDFVIGFGVDNVGLPPEMLPLTDQRVVVKIGADARFAVPRLDPTSMGCPNDPFAHASFHPEFCPCFSGIFYATAAATIKRCAQDTWITYALDQFDTPIFAPVGLRNTVDRLFVLILDTVVVPKFWTQLSPFVMDLKKWLPEAAPIKTITIKPSAPTAAPNPNVGASLLQARFALEVTAP